MTQRDSKRSKERTKDKAYKQRFSMVSSTDMAEFRPSPAFQTITPAPSRLGGIGFPGSSWSPLMTGTGGPTQPGSTLMSSPANGTFEICLIYSGAQVVHRVWDSMLISQLCMDAGSVFGLNQHELILVLFTGSPATLQRGATIVGPPRVTPGSTVMVFHVSVSRPHLA